jgi:hypothetical protein
MQCREAKSGSEPLPMGQSRWKNRSNAGSGAVGGGWVASVGALVENPLK